MIAIKNLQRVQKINPNRIRRITKSILTYLNLGGKDISLVFCDNKVIREINKTYLKRNRPTDVIAFNLSDEFTPQFMGEVFISVEEAIHNSEIFGTSPDTEVVLYIIHGILHLIGYKDKLRNEKIKMEKKQNEILRYLRNKKAL